MTVGSTAAVEHGKNAYAVFETTLTVCERVLNVAREYADGRVEALRDYQLELLRAENGGAMPLNVDLDYYPPSRLQPEFPPNYSAEIRGKLGVHATRCRHSVADAREKALALWTCTVDRCRQDQCNCIQKVVVELNIARKDLQRFKSVIDSETLRPIE